MNNDSLVEYGSRRVIITITAIMCALLEIVDSTIVNVALTQMQGNLGATLSEVSWVITAYAIGNVIIVPMTSWLSQQFGRRNYFAVSVIIFTICSFMCGQATGIWELVAFRFLQGLGGGALLVTSQTIITESYPPEKRGMAQAIYGLGVIIGPTLGPPLGGYIVDHFSWPYIFYINIPIGAIAAVMILEFVRSPKYAEKKGRGQIDWWGIVLLSVFVGSLQYILERGHEDDWFESTTILVLTVTAVLGFLGFLWRELVYDNPIVELRLLKNGNLRVGTILSFILGFGLYGSTFVIPLYTQSLLHWTAQQSGALMIPAAITTAFMMPMIGRALQAGAKAQLLVAAGMVMFVFFCLWGRGIMTPDTSKEDFFWPLILRGIGMGMLFIPITALSLSSLRGQQIGQGAAFTGMMRQLGGSFGVALITTIMANRAVIHQANVAASANTILLTQRMERTQAGLVARGVSLGDAVHRTQAMTQGGIMRQAAVLTYMDVFFYIGIMFLVCVPFVLLVRQKKAAAPVDLSAAH